MGNFLLPAAALLPGVLLQLRPLFFPAPETPQPTGSTETASPKKASPCTKYKTKTTCDTEKA